MEQNYVITPVVVGSIYLFLRILGEELYRLKTLSVNTCGLEDLDGVTYAPNLTTLVAADNNISDVYPVTELRKIHTLDLEKYTLCHCCFIL